MSLGEERSVAASADWFFKDDFAAAVVRSDCVTVRATGWAGVVESVLDAADVWALSGRVHVGSGLVRHIGMCGGSVGLTGVCGRLSVSDRSLIRTGAVEAIGVLDYKVDVVWSDDSPGAGTGLDNGTDVVPVRNVELRCVSAVADVFRHRIWDVVCMRGQRAEQELSPVKRKKMSNATWVE